MFHSLTHAQPDAILGLTEAFKKDPNPDKINLGVGVYKDAQGNTPIPKSVKKAEERLLKEESTKNYLAISGSAEYGKAVQKLLFGLGHEVLTTGRSETAQTPGGTGALRVAGDFLKKMFPFKTAYDPITQKISQRFQRVCYLVTQNMRGTANRNANPDEVKVKY